MPRTQIDKEYKRTIIDARRMIRDAEKADCNEAETRRRVERIFETVMGYDVLKHLSREHAVRGSGETEHVDFAIQLEEGEKARPEVMVEIKRVNINLSQKHLRQAASYAINAGSEWVILTNSKDWKLYHVVFGQPPIPKLINSWNILTDDITVLARHFNSISYKSVKKGFLTELWQKTNILHPRSLLQAILSDTSVKAIRRELRKDSGMLLAPEDVLAGIRRMLNESALKELENVKLTLSSPKPKRARKKEKETAESDETVIAEPSDNQDKETTDLPEDSSLSNETGSQV